MKFVSKECVNGVRLVFEIPFETSFFDNFSRDEKRLYSFTCDSDVFDQVEFPATVLYPVSMTAYIGREKPHFTIDLSILGGSASPYVQQYIEKQSNQELIIHGDVIMDDKEIVKLFSLLLESTKVKTYINSEGRTE